MKLLPQIVWFVLALISMRLSPPKPSSSRSEAELDKLIAELEKTKLEITRIRRENKYHWLRELASVVGLIVGIAGIVTISINVLAFNNTLRQNEQAETNRLLALLTSDSHLERLISVAGLRDRLDDESLARVMSVAIGPETDRAVRSLMLEAAASRPEIAAASLQNVTTQVNAELAADISMWGDVAEQEERAGGEPSSVLLERIIQLENTVLAKQRILVNSSVALAQIKCGVALGKSTPGDCPIDLSNANLRRYPLYEVTFGLAGADFRNASLIGSDLFDQDLQGADFAGAFLSYAGFQKTDLRNSDFTDAKVTLSSTCFWFPKEKMRERALFREAKLAGAKFDRACLGGADFRGSDISAGQLEQAWTEGALLPPDVGAELKTRKLIKGSEACKIECLPQP